MNIRKIMLTILFVAVLSAGIFYITKDKQSNNQGDKLSVAASFYPLYDFAKNVAGDKAQITNITPAGAEPHDYEPSASALVNAQKADVFIYNGGTLEPWTEKFIKDYHGVSVKSSDGITLLEGNDPHFWLDPQLAQKIIDNIRDGLIKADPENQTYYTQNAAAYNEKLAELDTEFQSGLANCEQDTVISSHDAFSYLANRYGLNVESIAGISPENEPSAERLAELSQIVNDKGIKYIFFETLVSSRLADTIAQETGAKTLVFNPIGGLTDEEQKQGKDYLSIQRENLQSLRTALACQ